MSGKPATTEATDSRLENVQREIERLSKRELRQFREWFAEYDWEVWDRELERDVAEGKLDKMAAKAIAAHQRGETTEL